jgi:hypothetical protein
MSYISRLDDVGQAGGDLLAALEAGLAADPALANEGPLLRWAVDLARVDLVDCLLRHGLEVNRDDGVLYDILANEFAPPRTTPGRLRMDAVFAALYAAGAGQSWPMLGYGTREDGAVRGLLSVALEMGFPDFVGRILQDIPVEELRGEESEMGWDFMGGLGHAFEEIETNQFNRHLFQKPVDPEYDIRTQFDPWWMILETIYARGVALELPTEEEGGLQAYPEIGKREPFIWSLIKDVEADLRRRMLDLAIPGTDREPVPARL